MERFSSVLPWFVLPFGWRTSVQALRLIFTVLRDFFLLQQKKRFRLVRIPLIYVDTELDDKIPFCPDKIGVYMGFIGFFVRPLTMMIRRFGYRKAAPYCNSFVSYIRSLYVNASSVYRFCMTTTHRPDYRESAAFRTIHRADPHYLCVPSLHVSIAAGTYAWMRNFLNSGIFPEEERRLRLDEILDSALAITESVLFVKQHSVNCIPVALYMITSTSEKEFFTAEDAVMFMSRLFRNSPEIPPGVREEITEYFIFMYERTFLENVYSDSWQDCIRHWLLDFAEATGQRIDCGGRT